ncbi:excinuclease ABC subunit UvrC [Clostridium estertheticum]|uniref:UvrABC system protein C n=1 Tax=Clostridium estertheticum subsp. estertheticum TaxID=1552 RepID=A0A1J0GLE8_9CLOT|nr:excinuclease ABC subunit UvrC [Clostridium estertheticum]APC42165.1 excinuclease ABC subunit C [Clostridium estertheticum subsp. estertheticum]MBU3073750.1 excinuclease ABC subunit UvrC [Clostridium estertheticum]MBU3163843.1 excinuclease ABC subunit UvrC [Clostridium estertheticum]MBU3184185.1 excinuclease ABC subunit UvrC [Clostridium estertheticum]MBZ9615918.1 excinuclease ABC subunit UvrC [Clostridium estertheticum subsp. laramiense]
MFDFDYQLKTLPDAPGVYLMKNNLGEIIYVGKAKILKNRVRQYFKSSKNHSVKVMAMVKNIAEFEYIVADSEMEALILECNLIKKYSPRYNILLKDDKHYPFIKITINEEFPRVFVTRNIANDGGKYFGPYTDSAAVYSTIELIKQIFPLRTCRRNIKEGVLYDRPCLNYHIGLCKAPCTGYISKEDYGKIIKGALDLLTGRDKSIKEDLRNKMETASEVLEFEKAAMLRDKIMAIEKINEKQKIIIGNCENEDFINVYVDEKDVCIQVFFLRDGKIVGREHFILNDEAENVENELIEEFIKRFYGGTAFIPKTIYVPFISEVEILEQWLSAKKDSKVTIKIPQKGEKKKTLEMVANNAKITLENFKLKDMQDKEIHKIAMREITELLKLDEIPDRIESYDISNIMGVDSVGSMVVFEGGKPKNSDYRRFKIKSVIGANDYDSMREILERRFRRGLDEVERIKERNLELSKGKFCVFPDLILMDGGKGQVNVALEVLNNLNIDIPVCGMVKDDRHKTRGLIYNNIELFMKSNSQSMHLITRVQDEVHRFAITYHRTLRDKRTLYSILDNIPNIGEKRRRELLKKFGSIDNIKGADEKELMDTPSMDSKSAECVILYFKNNK